MNKFVRQNTFQHFNLLDSNSDRTRNVKQNIFGSIAIKGVSIAISLILVPLTLGYVSNELYGVWLTLSSVLMWLAYLDVGFTLGLKNKLGEALAKQEFAKGKKLVSTTYFIMICIFVPLSVILLFISPLIDWCGLLNINNRYKTDVLHTIQLLSVFIAMQMIINVIVAVISAYQKVALSSLFQVIGQFLALLIIYMMTIFLPPSLPYLTLAYSFMPILVMFIGSLFLYNRQMHEVSPSFNSIDISYVKDLWGLGVKFFIIQMQIIVLYQSTNILISNIEGPLAVTQYNIAYKMLNIVTMVYLLVLNPLWPAFTDAYTKRDYVWMKSIYRKMSYAFCGIVGIVFILVLMSPYIYNIWVGDKVNVPFLLTVSLAIYTLIYCWDSLQVMLINGIGVIQLQTNVTLIGLLLHIPLSLFLGRYIGKYGVIVSMCIVNLVYVFFFTKQIRKILNQTAKGIWIK